MDSDGKYDVTYLINEVSRRVELSQKRIREYEKGGLIKPEREPRTNNRRYSEYDINQILRVKELIHKHGLHGRLPALFSILCPVLNCLQMCRERGLHGLRQSTHSLLRSRQKAAAHHGLKDCNRCPIDLNRDVRKMALLLQS